MKIKYVYKREPKLKNSETVKIKILSLKEYDCKFLTIDTKAKEGSHVVTDSIMIPVHNKADMDTLISKLQKLKEKFKD